MRPLTRLAERWPNVPLAGGLMAVLLLVAGLGVIFLNEATYRQQKAREIAVQADILGASVTAALDFNDAQTAQEAVDALRVNPQINAAGVFTPGGSLFAGYQRAPGYLPNRIDAAPARKDRGLTRTSPVIREGEHIGSVYLAMVPEPVARRVTRYSVIGLLVLLAVLVIVVLSIAHTALRRANRELEARAGALSDAYAELQVQMDERARAEDQLRQANKMQALGQLTGGIAHDFNNLLTVIQGSADVLRRPGLSEEKRIRFSEAIVETSARAAALTSQLLAFARRQPLRPEVIDLNERINSMADLLDRTLGERIEVRVELGKDLCPIEADPAQLESAILNICVNARDAMPEGGRLTIRTAEATLGEGGIGVGLSVTDTGTGIDPEALERVFEPFYTTKSVGKGTGLGLSQVYGFAAQSGGDIEVQSEVGEGTTVTLLLPCTERELAEPGAEASALPSAHRTGRILVVDDNEEVGAFAEALLDELGHQVVRARSGAQALTLARAAKFDVVFTDVVMPGMSGLELAAALEDVAPGVPIVFTTGFSDEIAKSGAGGRPIVFKPYRTETLAGVLDEVLAGKG